MSPVSEPADPPAETIDDLYDHAPCGYLTTSPAGEIVRANDTFLEWLGRPREAILGQRLSGLLTAGSRVFFETHCATRLKSAGAARHVALDLDLGAGAKMPTLMDIRTLTAPGGGVVGLRVVVTDTTERREHERDLILERERAKATAEVLQDLNDTLERRVEERTRELRDASDFARLALSAVGGVGVWTYDIALDRFVCDEKVAELYSLPPGRLAEGYSRAEFLSHVHPDDAARLASTMSDGLAASGDLELEYRIQHADGSTRWVLSRGSTHFEAGRPVRRTGIGVDRTKQRRLEEQFRQAQKMEAIGQLTGGVAHDFNNMLTVIRGSIDLLNREGISEERRARYLGAIADITDKASKLTSQLLAFARRQALQPEVFDAGRSILKIADMVRTLCGPQIEVEAVSPPEACFINVDPTQFDAAIINMAINARDAMDGAGRLKIVVEPVEDLPPGRGRGAVPGAFVAVAISDTGCGVPPGDLDRIFEPFFTTKPTGKGTGLGLSQVFGFAGQSGGEILVDSAIGVGTTFRIYLPRAEGSGLCVRELKRTKPLDGQGVCVLLVEDNADVGVFAKEALSELGYRAVWAAEGKKALDELAANPSDFDIVFSDMIMPGMSGLELARVIGRQYPDLPVVLTSGYSHVLANSGALEFPVLRKPYSIEQLSEALQRVMSAS